MIESEFDKLIRHHEYQAKLWHGGLPIAHQDHKKWVAQLRALKEVTDVVRQLLEIVEAEYEEIFHEEDDNPERLEWRDAIDAGRAVLAEAEKEGQGETGNPSSD